MTRRSKKYSGLHAVIVEWSRYRKRHERRGILAEQAAIDRAVEECSVGAEFREMRRNAVRLRMITVGKEVVGRSSEEIKAVYAGCPDEEREVIAFCLGRKHSGETGRLALAECPMDEVIAGGVEA